MIIPSYWASSRKTHRQDGRSYTVRRWGWSDVSQAAAQTHAEMRVDQAIDKVVYQWPNPLVPKHEPKTAYNGAEGVPIREEVIQRVGHEVVTRNGYGALCLNTPDTMFVDVDQDKIYMIPPGRLMPTLLVLLALAAILAAVFHAPQAPCSSHPWWLWGLFLLLAPWLLNRAWRSIEVALAGGPHGVVQRQLDKLLAREPSGAWALYRTPAGYRVMALHRHFDPASTETRNIMDGFMADPLYALMCRKQGCFRARVSPKPWRMQGMERMRGPVWPVEGQALERRQQWVEHYEKHTHDYASCKFIAITGSVENSDAHISRIRDWHDAMCQAHTEKPLA